LKYGLYRSKVLFCQGKTRIQSNPGQVALMDFIVENIAIGSYEDAIDIRNLQSHEITAVLNVAREVNHYYPPSILRLQIPLDDGEPIKREHLKLAINFLKSASSERKVLVHCLAGISRSTAIVMCYLHEARGMSLDDAFSFIKAKRSQAQPHPALIQSVQSYYESAGAQI
jgi:protein-tyrosine phosphatase